MTFQQVLTNFHPCQPTTQGQWCLQSHNLPSIGAFLQQCGYTHIPHPAYSPNPALIDFWFFPMIKKDIRAGHVRTSDQLEDTLKEYLDMQINSGNLLVNDGGK